MPSQGRVWGLVSCRESFSSLLLLFLSIAAHFIFRYSAKAALLVITLTSKLKLRSGCPALVSSQQLSLGNKKTYPAWSWRVAKFLLLPAIVTNSLMLKIFNKKEESSKDGKKRESVRKLKPRGQEAV